MNSPVMPYPGMVIDGDIAFQPGVYSFFGQEGIIIAADNITIDGNGAVFVGGSEKAAPREPQSAAEFAYGQGESRNASLGYYGTGVFSRSTSGVTLKNLTVSGFELGLRLEACSDWDIENNDFSGNYHNPAHGWDEHDDLGGIMLYRTHGCRIRGNRAREVWNGLTIRYGNGNNVAGNDFSHTSNVGLRLWRACRNTFAGNDFSWGLRIEPGEVHARDSSCVLIESGSNANTFRDNDMTHGGDGLFIRVLNGWMSTGNLFERNDCSYANNNAIEAWADNNTYINNKANYSSYGFWLGNSDNTVLIGNEAAFNGTLRRNAPEAFGICGIAVVNGSGSHYVMEDNYIHDNNGPGVAIRYKKDYPVFHWVIQNNRIENNTRAGIYMRNVSFMALGGNSFANNGGGDTEMDGNVSDVVRLAEDAPPGERLKIFHGSDIAVAGKMAEFYANLGDGVRWDMGDGTVRTGSHVSHIYRKSGFYRLAATACGSSPASIDFINLYVCEDGEYLPLDDLSAEVDGSYTVERDYDWTLTRNGSARVTAVSGKSHRLRLPLSLKYKPGYTVSGYIRYLSDREPDWKNEIPGPTVRLVQDGDNYIEYKPHFMFNDMFSDNESRNNWIKLRLDEGYSARINGVVDTINSLELIFNCADEANESLTVIYIDAFCYVPEYEVRPIGVFAPSSDSGFPKVIAGGEIKEYSDIPAPAAMEPKLRGDATPRVVFNGKGYYGVEFGALREVDTVEGYIYHNVTSTLMSHNETLPCEITVEYLNDGQWAECFKTGDIGEQGNIFSFDPVRTTALRIVMIGEVMALYGFRAYNSRAVDIAVTTDTPNRLAVDCFEVKLRKEINGNGSGLGDLVARVYSLSTDGTLADCLFEATVPEGDIDSGGITAIDADLEGLAAGEKYALVLGQTETAKSRTEGDYYRWIAGHEKHEETFAIFTDGMTKPSDYNWGTAWLKVHAGGLCSDYSHDSEHIGTRFGIADMQFRYMTFAMPDSLSALTDGAAADGCAGFVMTHASLTVDLRGKEARSLRLWLAEDLSEAARIYINQKEYILQSGFNEIAGNFAGEIKIRSDTEIPIKLLELEAV